MNQLALLDMTMLDLLTERKLLKLEAFMKLLLRNCMGNMRDENKRKLREVRDLKNKTS